MVNVDIFCPQVKRIPPKIVELIDIDAGQPVAYELKLPRPYLKLVLENSQKLFRQVLYVLVSHIF